MSRQTDLEYGIIENYVGGVWTTPRVEGQSVDNPATGETIARVGFSSEEDINAAVADAQAAFE